ncbi:MULTISPECIES: pilus assembly protein [Rhodomicrobium]|uniref:pilus assembly protein n=1 Tax=Rhodomicrobium TaxID=1068 RepID=UPI00148202B6|nr:MULTISPECIES: pilus assembly protein [Rhodomicrobium]
MCRLIRRWRRDERGAVLILFALVVLPLLMIIALVIDFSQSLVVKRQLTAAVDSAALALGSLPQIKEPGPLKAKAEEYIRANYTAAAIGDLTGSTAVRNGDSVTVTATATVPTAFMGLAGVNSLTVNVSSTVVRRDTKLEVVMVLDNSGSMNDRPGVGEPAKIESLRSAANTLVDTLFTGIPADSDRVKIGLVPFTGGVNVKDAYAVAGWDAPNPAPALNQLDRVHPAALNYALFSDLDKGKTPPESTWSVLGTMGTGGQIGTYWKGCLRSRANPYDTDDTAPAPGNADTLFSAYFNPYDGSRKNAYRGDTGDDQNFNCPAARVQPLTSDKAVIQTAIKNMVAEGSTNIPEGLAWGWRVISPTAPFTEGAPYSAPDTVKAIVVLSDGANNVSGFFSSYGEGNRDNAQIGPSVNAGLDAKMNEVCTNIKKNWDDDDGDQDIVVYSIAFNVSGDILNRMRDCASEPKNFFNSPTAESLENAFAAIAASLNQLRLTQ